MRICVVSERLAPPFDEGFKNAAISLIREWSKQHELLALTCSGADIHEPLISNIAANRLFLSAPMLRAIRRFRPKITYYIPTASTTAFSFGRARVLRAASRGGKVVLVALQPRRPGRLSAHIIRLLPPDLLLSASPEAIDLLPRMGCPAIVIPLGVDLDRFAPGAPSGKPTLREKHGIPRNSRVILHVGHIKRERNVQMMAQLQAKLGCQAVVIGSTSTDQDLAVAQELCQAGVVVISEYVDIVQAYHLADAYIFPVWSDMAAIGVPLSVLEAMACNLPVVTTPFGGLPGLFEEHPEDGLWFASSNDHLVGCARAMAGQSQSRTRDMVSSLSWSDVARGIVEMTQGMLG